MAEEGEGSGNEVESLGGVAVGHLHAAEPDIVFGIVGGHLFKNFDL